MIDWHRIIELVVTGIASYFGGHYVGRNGSKDR